MMAQVSRLSHFLPKLEEPLRLVQLSDLHFGLYTNGKDVSRWVEQTLNEAPDLILLTGDFMDRLAWRSSTGLIEALKPLSAPLGVWGVWGNHDHNRSRVRHLKPAFERLGIQILVNEGRTVRDDLFLVGIDEEVQPWPDIEHVFSSKSAETACIAMSHSPDTLPQLPLAIDLVLAGHTHGGQIKLPGLGALRTSSIYGQRFLEGWIREENLPLAYVSRGLGTTALPIRWGSPSELVVLEISRTLHSRQSSSIEHH